MKEMDGGMGIESTTTSALLKNQLVVGWVNVHNSSNASPALS